MKVTLGRHLCSDGQPYPREERAMKATGALKTASALTPVLEGTVPRRPPSPRPLTLTGQRDSEEASPQSVRWLVAVASMGKDANGVMSQRVTVGDVPGLSRRQCARSIGATSSADSWPGGGQTWVGRGCGVCPGPKTRGNISARGLKGQGKSSFQTWNKRPWKSPFLTGAVTFGRVTANQRDPAGYQWGLFLGHPGRLRLQEESLWLEGSRKPGWKSKWPADSQAQDHSRPTVTHTLPGRVLLQSPWDLTLAKRLCANEANSEQVNASFLPSCRESSWDLEDDLGHQHLQASVFSFPKRQYEA